MKKKSFTRACSYRCKTKRLAALKRKLKRQRHKRARQGNPVLVYATCGNRDVI